MKQKFSRKWKASRKPSKQRKYKANAMKHVKNKLAGAHLSKELAKKHGKRKAALRVGDKVKVMRGQFRKKSGKIERVDTSKSKVYITGIEFVKKDGSKALYPIHASNVSIQELAPPDKKRMKREGGKSS